MALANARGDIGRDLRWRQAETGLAEGKTRAARRNHDIRAAGQAHSAAKRRTVDQSDGDHRMRVQTRKEMSAGPVGFLQWIGLALSRGVDQGLGYGFEIGARTEDVICAGDDEGRKVFCAGLRERAVDCGDHLCRERILTTGVV